MIVGRLDNLDFALDEAPEHNALVRNELKIVYRRPSGGVATAAKTFLPLPAS